MKSKAIKKVTNEKQEPIASTLVISDAEAGEVVFQEDSFSNQLQTLIQEIRTLLKDGKITIHSVLAIWVGSPFGAVEAFKIIGNDRPEMETKFSCAIFDVIDIIQNLQREDPTAFWSGGKMHSALAHLVPLATDSIRLYRKVQRITSGLESYSTDLQKIVEDLQNLKRRSLVGDSSLKNPKSGNCYKFRRAFRQAWYTFSKQDRKAIESAPKDDAFSRNEITDDVLNSTPKQPPCVHFHNEIRTPERNKSDGIQVNKCNFNHNNCPGNFQCPAYFSSNAEYQARLRIVPSHLFVEPPPEQSNKHHEDCHCCENNPAGDVPQCQCQCYRNQHHQPDDSTNVTPGEMEPLHRESQPFELTMDNETSYLKDYEMAHTGVNGCESRGPTTDLHSTHDLSNGNIENLNNSNNNDEAAVKEVVIVRSAVSDFAESEYGVIEKEDMEWLDKIKQMGQTGHICADEIEQSERLKRQSIFLHCIKYRTDEILKDLHNVLKMIRSTERKWLERTDVVNLQVIPEGKGGQNMTHERKIGLKVPPAGKVDHTVIPEGKMDLRDMISTVHKACQIITKRNKNPGTNVYNLNDAELDKILESIQLVQTEASGVQKSFQRFLKMISEDTSFLKQLCLGFSPRPSPDEEIKECYLSNDEKSKHGQGALSIGLPAFNFYEIFDD